MPTNIDMHIRLAANGVQLIDQTWNENVGAIDDIVLDLADATVDDQVDIQPGPASAISFIGIANLSAVPGISYKSAPGGMAITLLGVHAYTGAGMAAFLGANPTALFFSNASGQAAQVRIVVARQT
jgi:hypothetical protein